MDLPSDENLNLGQNQNKVSKSNRAFALDSTIKEVRSQEGQQSPSSSQSQTAATIENPDPESSILHEEVALSDSEIRNGDRDGSAGQKLMERSSSRASLSSSSDPTRRENRGSAATVLSGKEEQEETQFAPANPISSVGLKIDDVSNEKKWEKSSEKNSSSPHNSSEGILEESSGNDTEQQQNEPHSNLSATIAPASVVSGKTGEFGIVEVKRPRSDTSNSSLYSSLDAAASNFMKTDSNKAFEERLSQDASEKTTERISSLPRGSFKNLELFHHQFVGELPVPNSSVLNEDSTNQEKLVDYNDVITTPKKESDVGNNDMERNRSLAPPNPNENVGEEISGIVNRYIDLMERDWRSKQDLWKELKENKEGSNVVAESSSIFSYPTFQECVSDKKIDLQVPFDLDELKEAMNNDKSNGKFEFKRRGSITHTRRSATKIPSRKNSRDADVGTENNKKSEHSRRKGSKEKRSNHDLRTGARKATGNEESVVSNQAGQSATQGTSFVSDINDEARSELSVMMEGIFTAVSQTSMERLQDGVPDETKLPLTSAEKVICNFVRKYINFLEREWKRRRSLWLEEMENNPDQEGQDTSPYVHETFVECVANNQIKLQVPFELPDFKMSTIIPDPSEGEETAPAEDSEETTAAVTPAVVAPAPEDSSVILDIAATVLEACPPEIMSNESKVEEFVVEENVSNIIPAATVDETVVEEETIAEPTKRTSSWWRRLLFLSEPEDAQPTETKPDEEKQVSESEELASIPTALEEESGKTEVSDTSANEKNNANNSSPNSSFDVEVADPSSHMENALSQQPIENTEDLLTGTSKKLEAQEINLEVQSTEPVSSSTMSPVTTKDGVDEAAALENKITSDAELETAVAPLAAVGLKKGRILEGVKVEEKPQYVAVVNGRNVACSSMDQKTRLEICSMKLSTLQSYAANLKDVSILPGAQVLPYLNMLDFKNCRLVCKVWNNGIINSKDFLSTTTFVIEKKPLGALATLEASRVRWQNLRCSMIPSVNMTASSSYNGRFLSTNLRMNSRSEPITNTVTTVFFESMEINRQQLVHWIQNCKRLSSIIVENCSILKSSISVNMDKANRVMEKIQLMKFSDMHPVKLADVLRFFLPATRRLHTLEIIQRKEAKGTAKSTTFTARKGAEEDIAAVLCPALKKNRQSLKNLAFEFTSAKNYLVQRKIVDTLGSETFQLSSLVIHSYLHMNTQPCLKIESYGSTNLTVLLKGTLKNSTDMKVLDFPMLAIDFKSGKEGASLLPSKLEKLAAQLEMPTQENFSAGVVFNRLRELELYGTSPLDNIQWRQVRKAMPHLTQLVVNASGLKDANLQSIIYHLKHLKVLRLENVADITDSGITGVEVGWIERLKMYWPEKYDQIPKDKVRFTGKPLSSLGDLQTFAMSGNFSISNVGILFGFNSQGITTLELNGSPVNASNSGLFILGFQCPYLRRLRMVVQHSKATPAGIQHLYDSLAEKIPSQFQVDVLPSLDLPDEAIKHPMIAHY